MKRYNYTVLAILVFIISGCANYVVNDSLKQRLHGKKVSATLIKPDTHVITIDGNNTREIASQSAKASSLFESAIKREFQNIVYINGVSSNYCPLITTDEGVDSNSCSLLIKSLREAYDKATRYPKYTKSKKLNGLKVYGGMPASGDISLYFFAVEPTRSAGEATKDFMVSLIIGALTGFAPTRSYSDKVVLMVIDNSTSEVLWLDTVAGGDIDLDEQKDVDDAIKKLAKNFKEYISK